MGLFLLANAATSTVPTSDWAKEQAPVIEEPTYPTYTVSMTGYNDVPEQTDDTPHITSIGLPVNPEVGAAASRDLIAGHLPYGTVIELSPGAAEYATGGCELPAVEDYIQYRVITDTMAARHKKHVDIQFGRKQRVTFGKYTLNAAVAIGWCNNVKIRVVGHIDLDHMPKTQKELQLALGRDTAELAINK